MEDFHLFICIFFLLYLPLLASSADKKLHIVYLGVHDDGVKKTVQEIEENHHSYLLSVKETEEDAKSSIVYNYKYSINGFAALLTRQEASKLSDMDGVVSVFVSHPRKYSLQTTRSWDFTASLEKNLGSNTLENENSFLQSKNGSNVIIGIIDSGVWPESESFNDEEMDDVPTSWKGICQPGKNFNSSHCNKKIIGARYFIGGYENGELNLTLDNLSPRDINGHGTHTASIAAGRRVQNVSALGGFARGTATGGAPQARLAVYKVCWAVPDEDDLHGIWCLDVDILAAIDQAINDGVNVLSISIGGDPQPYDEDVIAIGALHAAKRNIVMVCSAGNYGPAPGTLSNSAPWLISVAASTVDRIFSSAVVLGNGTKITGQTVTPFEQENKLYPLAYAGQVVELKPNVSETLSGQCLYGSLSPEKTKGKIILCLLGNGTRAGKSMEVKRAGGIGVILGFSEANGFVLNLEAHLIPTIAVDHTNALQILKYINFTKEPKASFEQGTTVLDTKPAPVVTGYSSRGPNTISPDILKPDITAPGQNILAAWSEAASPTNLVEDKRVVKYNIASGTSMSCPHIAGVSALLKAIHPDWSSAAIRSALMTSAGQINNEGNPITDASGNPADPFQFGSGHVRPAKAADPGLVYDASYEDYLRFLCSIGVKNLDASFKCPKNSPSPAYLNYPSLAIPKLNGTVSVVRTVTNVGSGNSVYNVSVKPPTGISVNILPSTLYFNGTGQKRSFTITVKKDSTFTGKIEKDKYLFGWYTLSDKIHTVRSPMAISVS